MGVLKNVGKVTYTFVCMGLLLFVSCKSTKTVAGGTADSRLSAKRIIENHYGNQTNFKTLSGRVKIDYTDGDKNQGISVSLRMEKDKVIWISAPFGMVKAHITPEQVSFYNKLEGEYFDGDFSYLSDLLGTELDFEKVQNLLLGNAVFDLRKEKYASEVSQGAYQLKPKKAGELFEILFLLEPKNFKISTQEISQPWENRQLSAKYTYQDISGNILPDEVQILAKEDEDITNIGLGFKNVELNRTLSFPYKIPKGFKEIVLK